MIIDNIGSRGIIEYEIFYLKILNKIVIKFKI